MIRGWKGLGKEGSIGFVAALLEAEDGFAEAFGHELFDEEDTVDVVGHHLKGKDLYLWMVARDGVPRLRDGIADGREFNMGIGGASGFCEGIAHKATQQGTAPFHSECNEIDAAVAIVMMVIAAFHGRLRFTCKTLLGGYLFLGLHTVLCLLHGKSTNLFSLSFTFSLISLHWLHKSQLLHCVPRGSYGCRMQFFEEKGGGLGNLSYLCNR